MRTLLLIITFAAICGAGGAYLWYHFGGFDGEQAHVVAFVDVYTQYSDVANQVETLVHVPGAEGNSDRAQLLVLLETILTKDITDERRMTLARLALSNVQTLKSEVDQAQAAQESLYESLRALDTVSKSFKSVSLRDETQKIVLLARERAALSAHIISVLSNVNTQTSDIVVRIIKEKGALTNAHVQDINAKTDEAQKRFDTLTSLYAQLVNKKQNTETLFASFVQHAI